MRLSNRKSYITSLPEGSPPKNIRPQITQIIYYIVLLALVIYIITIFGARFFYFTEPGFVEVDKTIISSSQGGKILTLNIKEGQKVYMKKQLAVIAASKNCGTIFNQHFDKIHYALALNKTKLSHLKREISDIKNQLSNFSLQRALETGSNNSQPKLSYALAKKQNERSLLEGQIILQQQQLKKTNASSQTNTLSTECSNETIVAPFKGYVSSLQRKLNEYTARGAALLTLVSEDASVRIEVYLKNDQLPYLNIGKQVDVIFNDNLTTPAIIKSINSSAYTVPEREWNHYQPADTQVRVHLEPINNADAQIWKKYDRLQVSVRGSK